MELYQFYQQMIKHLWAIDEWEYAVGWGGLDFITDEDCFQIYPSDDDSTYYYAGALPLPGGRIKMSLFEDGMCVTPRTDLAFEDVYVDQYYLNSYWSQFDDDQYRYMNGQAVGYASRRLDEEANNECRGDDRRLENNGGNNGGYMDCFSWASAREPQLDAFNEVFSTYQYCTPCVDYPSYQDGYLIGDYGTDEDDLVNQCWKFISHDSYPCTGKFMGAGS